MPTVATLSGLIGWASGQISMPGLLSLARLTIITIICGLVARAFYNVFLHPLHRVPGPWWFAASGLPRFRMYNSGFAHRRLVALHARYGDTVRIGPDEVSIAGARSWSEVAGQKRLAVPAAGADPHGAAAATYVENPKERLFYSYAALPTSIIRMPQAEHTVARRTLAPAFSAKAVAEQEPLVQQYVDQLVVLMRQTAAPAGPHAPVADMAQYLNWALFDIIGELGFGEAFGSLAHSAEHAWVRFISEGVMGAALRANVHRLVGARLADLGARLLVSRSVRERMAWHRGLSADKVARRAAAGPGRPDFMTPMLQHADFWTPDRLRGTSASLITAGSETSATTLTVALFYLTSPDTAARRAEAGDTSAPGESPLAALTREVRGAFAADADIDFASVRSLPYLGAVIDETLRMHPPAASGFPREAHAGGARIGGYDMPQGTVLSINHYCTYRNPRNFVLADRFFPERWLGDDRFQADRREAFQPFSYGPRNCIGRHLAMSEMRTILARIVFNFDLELDPASYRWEQDQRAYAFWVKDPLHIKISERAS